MGATPFFFRHMTPKDYLFAFVSSAVDAGMRILALVTLEQINTALAFIIGLLSIVHLVLKIRKETRNK